ncbi:uncharacterized protein LOC135200635 [Macrobrachium nipponense]|uniref:uncharacterized protein LOC135200635 n=1 Tax=Macrobrachium nipponense TaxID=159736 RepID=UPI0030C7EE71
MSKVRPKRGPRLSPTEEAPPLVLETPAAASNEENNSSTEYTSPTSSCSSGTSLQSTSTNITAYSASSENDSYFNPLTNMFKQYPYSMDSGFGIMNPMFDDASEVCRLPDIPLGAKPFIPASQSLPIMSSGYTDLLSPTQMTYSVCSSAGSERTKMSVRSPGISTPPNTPISPALDPSQGAWVARCNSSNIKCSNTTSPNLVTPPNTPLSNLLSPSKEDSDHSSQYSTCSDRNDLYTPAMAVEGQLYNILGRPVDLPNKKSPVADSVRISPTDTESKLYPFPSYPSPSALDSFTDSEKVIKHLIKLGNGIYDEGSQKGNIYGRSPELERTLPKSDDWINYQDKTQTVAPCWTQPSDKSKLENHLQREGDEDKTRKQNGTTPQEKDAEKNSNLKSGSEKEQIRDPSPTEEEVKSPEEGDEDGANKRDSLFADLEVPMIDEDTDNGMLDTPTASVSDRSSSSGKKKTGLLEEEAEELAEQLCDITNEAGRLLTKELKQGISYLTKPEDTVGYSWIDTLAVFISIGLFYFDVASDCSLAYNMYYDRDTKNWFTITALFLIIPLILANAFSLYWYWFDERVCEPHGACYRHPKVPSHVWVFRVLAHLLLHGSILRQMDILYYGSKSTEETMVKEAVVDEVMAEALNAQLEDGAKKNRGPSKQRGFEKCTRRTGGVCSRGGYVALWIHAERDAANVDMLLSLVQDAPQLILHFYILALTLPGQVQQGQFSQTLVWQITKEGFSFMSLAWSVTSFIRAIRLVEPTMSNLSLIDLLWLTLAHLFSIAGQVMSFALFASKFLLPFWVVAGSHWMVMAIWILVQLSCFPRTTCTRAVFAHDQRYGPCSKLDDIIYSIIMGFVFLFTFVDVGGISPRTQFFFYHVFRLLEQTILVVIWFVWVNGSAWYHWLAIILVPVFSILNIFFDAIFCASTRPVTCLLLCKAPKPL